ncbi:18566_t:CDS:2, partial [Acaulospora morrowiae]
MGDNSLLLKTVKDIQSSLAVLPQIQASVMRLTDAIMSLEGNGPLRPSNEQKLTNGISSSHGSPELLPVAEAVEINENDLINHKSQNEKGINHIDKEKKDGSVAGPSERSRKKMSITERRKLKKEKRKQTVSQGQGDLLSNEDVMAQQSQSKTCESPQIQEKFLPTRTTQRSARMINSGSNNKERQDRRFGRGQSNQNFNNYFQRERETLQNNWDKSEPTFEGMNLKPELLKGIRDLGYDQPTPIQQRALTALLTRHDAVIQIPRSEERTLTYVIAILQLIDARDQSCQAIILVHNKDLCYAIQDLINVVSKHLQISWSVCVGGYSVRQDVEKLRNVGQQIILGTPGKLHFGYSPFVSLASLNSYLISPIIGRLIDLMIDRRSFDASRVRMVVVEDSCIMFNSTFRSQALDIIHRSPSRAQRILMTTATTFTLADVKNRLAKNAHIVVNDVHMSEGLQLYYKLVEKEEEKLNALCELFKMLEFEKSIIFCDNAERVDWLADKLTTLFEHMNVFSMHSMTKQSERHDIVKSFWNVSPAIIVTTDSFAAVLAFQPVKYTIHFDLPFKKEDYHDRICCSGGYGLPGTVVNLLVKGHLYDLGSLERYYKIQSQELP